MTKMCHVQHVVWPCSIGAMRLKSLGAAALALALAVALPFAPAIENTHLNQHYPIFGHCGDGYSAGPFLLRQVADPFPLAGRSLALAESSRWYVTNAGQSAQAIRIFNLTNSIQINQPLSSKYAVLAL